MRTPSPTTCRDQRRTLDAIVDGCETAHAREGLEQHATVCSRCATELERATSLRRLIESAPEAEMDASSEDDFILSVMGRLEEPGAEVPQVPVLRRRGPWIMAIGGAAAAAALLTLTGPSAQEVRSTQAPNPSQATITAHEGPAAPVAQVGDREPVRQGHTHPGFEVESSRVDLAPGEFASAIRAASLAVAFDPTHDLDGGPFVAALVEALGSAPHVEAAAIRSARELLRTDAGSPLAPLAARLLGPRADLRGRRLLEGTLSKTGLAGALALGERGRSGVESLWRLAAGSEFPAAEGQSVEAQATRTFAEQGLERLGAAGHDLHLSAIDLERHLALAARIIGASGSGASATLLERFLDDGHIEWLDAWESTEDREPSLDAVLRQRTSQPDTSTIERTLLAIERIEFADGLDFTVAALELGVREAPSTLASLPGDAPLHALLGVSQAGQLRLEVEDLAWSAMVQRRSADLVDLVVAGPGDPAERADFIVSRLALITERTPAARRTLVRVGLEDSLTVETRVRALLLALEGDDGQTAAVLQAPMLITELGALTESAETALAAAAWMVLHRIDAVGTQLSERALRALLRPSTHSVMHLRVTRALDKDRDRTRTRSL